MKVCVWMVLSLNINYGTVYIAKGDCSKYHNTTIETAFSLKIYQKPKNYIVLVNIYLISLLKENEVALIYYLLQQLLLKNHH